jgi:hypothetical protein
MDQRERDATTADQVILDELLRNEKMVEHPAYGTVKLQRPTPRKERLISELRSKQYHRDLQAREPDGTPSILSRAQLEAEAMQRGIWTQDKKDRASYLRESIGSLMTGLEAVGYNSVEDMLVQYHATVNKILLQFADNLEAASAVSRYFDMDSEAQSTDDRIIRDASPSTEVDELKEEAETYRAQIDLMTRLSEARKELNDLMSEYVRLVKDSIESRMDRVEEMAHIYYCATKEDGTPLWAKFEDMWDSYPHDIALLQEELFYFTNCLSDDLRRMMGKHGFTVRVPEATSEPRSEDSPEHPVSSSVGESPESAPLSS